MIRVPSGEKELLAFTTDLIEKCRISVGARSAYYRLMNVIAETGRYDGTKSLINLMNGHLTRSAAHLFSPVELKFTLDFWNVYPKETLENGAIAAKNLTREWDRNSTDLVFGRGVFEALKYGGTVLKQWSSSEGTDANPCYNKKLVMPWQFGVYREDENEIDKQEALCETSTLTLPEVWQRIWHFPDAKKLFEKIKVHAKKGEAGADPSSFFHSVLNTSQINTSGLAGQTTSPGGILQINNDPNYALMGPVIGADVVQMHELWVKDENDYVTIQMIEPDILICPLYKKANLFIEGSRLQPYTLIQPNEVTNWFWGRSDLVDMIEPQGLLSVWCEDAKRLLGLQVDKILAFSGEDGMTDEMYGNMREAGWANLGQSGKVEDITPKFPTELLPMIKWLVDTINTIGGFPDIMQGKGESGVRAGVHANTLLKTASPTLRDRSLIVERQCATAADRTLTLMEAKDPRKYWTKADKPLTDTENTSFILSELPEDWRVTVDSHSSSPIFSDDNNQLIWQAHKSGIVDGAYVVDHMPFPDKESIKVHLREKAEQQAQFMKKIETEHPELLPDILKKQAGGHGKH